MQSFFTYLASCFARKTRVEKFFDNSPRDFESEIGSDSSFTATSDDSRQDFEFETESNSITEFRSMQSMLSNHGSAGQNVTTMVH